MLKHAAQTNLKRVALELGGKSPQVVMADAANLDRVADRVANAIFWNMGENCSAGSRLIVDRRIRSALVDRLVGLVERDWIVGDPMDNTTRVGPAHHAGPTRVVSSIGSPTIQSRSTSPTKPDPAVKRGRPRSGRAVLAHGAEDTWRPVRDAVEVGRVGHDDLGGLTPSSRATR